MKTKLLAFLCLATAAFAQNYAPETIAGLATTVVVATGTGGLPASDAYHLIFAAADAVTFDRWQTSGIARNHVIKIGRSFTWEKTGQRTATLTLVDSAQNSTPLRMQLIFDTAGSARFQATSGAATQEGSFIVQAVTAPTVGRAINLSTRAPVAPGQPLVVGIVVANGTKRFLFRGIGPSLTAFGVPDALRDPRIELKDGRGVTLAANDNWNGASSGPDVGAFPLSPTSLDAVLVATLGPGNYTLTVTGSDGGSGVALAEAYELP